MNRVINCLNARAMMCMCACVCACVRAWVGVLCYHHMAINSACVVFLDFAHKLSSTVCCIGNFYSGFLFHIASLDYSSEEPHFRCLFGLL